MNTPLLRLAPPSTGRRVPARRFVDRSLATLSSLRIRRYDDRPSFERFSTPSDMALRAVSAHDLHR